MTPATVVSTAPDPYEAAGRWLRASAELATRTGDFLRVIQDPPEVDVGETPCDVVHRDNKMRLLRYRPLVQSRQVRTPVVITYALVNKPTILDLQPDRSVVRALLKQGLDVYLIDWGTPSELDQGLTLEDHVSRYMHDSVRRAMELSDAPDVTLLGYCMGGTMSVMFAAFHPDLVRNLILMAAPLDFSGDDGGLLWKWSRPEHFDVDRFVDATGNVAPEFLNSGYQYLRPVENTVGKFHGFWQMAGDDSAVENFLRMEKWVNDGIPVPRETYRQFIKDVYQENRLSEGLMILGRRRVDLGTITMPILALVGEHDHLVPKGATLRILDRLPSTDTTVFDERAGHIGLSVGSRSHRVMWPKVAEWIIERSS